jgi:FkbM family methyltransferase
MDSYWTDLADFLDSASEPAGVSLAPRGVAEAIPGLTPFEDWDHLQMIGRVIVHKGMVDEIPSGLLEGLFGTAHSSFANEVFVVYDITPTSDEHVRAAQLALAEKAVAGNTRDSLEEDRAMQGRMAVYLGGHHALTRTIYGQKMFVETSDVDLAPHLLLDGYWERHVTRLFRRLVQPGTTIVEIGANVGYYTLIAADIIGPSGRVVAFEANPTAAAICFRNLEINGLLDRATVINKAVHAISGRHKLQLSEHHLGGASLYATKEWADEVHDSLHEIEIEAVCLDEYFTRGQRVDFLKIDAEGAEPEILRGAHRLLADNPQVVALLEYGPSILMRAYGSVQPFWDEVAACGFNAFEVMPDGSLHELGSDDKPRALCDVLLRR